MITGQATSERNQFFLELAKKSGIENRMSYFSCYMGYSCEVIPDEENAYLWHIEFDRPDREENK